METHIIETVRWKDRLKTRMVLSLITIMTMLLLVFGVYRYAQIKSESTQELNELATMVVAQLAEQLAVPLWNFDTTQAEYVILSEMMEKRIYGVLLRRDREASLLIGKKRDEAWQIIDTQEEMSGRFLIERQDIVKDGENLGDVEVYVTPKFMNVQLRNGLVETLLSIVILDLAVFIALWLVTRSITQPIVKIVAIANAMANGDFCQEITIRQRDEVGLLAEAFRKLIATLNQVVNNVKLASDNVASGSQAMRSSAVQMSQGVSAQAAAAEEASSSMEQMAANIRQNAENALQTDKIAITAAQNATESGQVVAGVVKAMQEIANKITIIEDITRQTRMLSLNATIEAARAQDHGRGFAVVASEVRALAERSQTAATEINQLASSSVAIAEQAGEMLTKLVPDIQKTAELVQEISAASKEQDTGAGQINRAIQQLDQVTQQNAATSEELAATAEELAAQAEHLQNAILFFTIDATEQQPAKKTVEEILPPGQHKIAQRGDEHDDEFERY